MGAAEVNDQDREESVIRTLEQSHLDLLGAVQTEADRRHASLKVWQARMEARWLHVAQLLIFMVAVGVAAAVGGGLVYAAQNRKIEAQAERVAGLVAGQRAQVAANTIRAAQINHVLCVVRRDYEARARGARKFLRSHPEGFAGISAGTIRVSLRMQERTIRSLSGLECGTPAPALPPHGNP
jgi:hypothetical protein